MAERKSIWELFLRDSVSKTMSALSGVADKVSDKFASTQDRINKFSGSIRTAASEIPGLGRAFDMIKNPAILMGASLALIGTGLYKSANASVEFETGMAKINATAQLGEATLGKLKNRIMEIGSDSGGNFELMPGAYEKILSQTGKVNLSLDILETSVLGAKAGFTDIDTVAGALAQTLSIVGEKNASAKEVMDTLMMAKNLGAGEFKDFAQYIPQLIAAGKNLNVAYKDTAGLFSYMTGKGLSAADSAMLMQNAFTALQKDNVVSGLEKKGIKLFDAKGARRNIQEVFLDLTSRLDGLTDRQKTKFFIDIGLNDAQAKSAFSVLTSDGEKFKRIMDGVNKSMGETDRQLAATANHARTWGDIKDKFSALAVTIGDKLIPIVDKLLDGVEGIFNLFSSTGRRVNNLSDDTGISKAQAQKLVNLGFQPSQVYTNDDDVNAAKRLLSFQGKIDKMMAGAITDKAKNNAIVGFNEMKKILGTSNEDKTQSNMLNAAIVALSGKGNFRNKIVEGEEGDTKKLFGDKTTTLGDNSKFKDGLDSISGGGKAVRNVYVNINKLIEEISVHAATIKESTGEITRIVEEAVLRAIHGSELILANE